MGRPRGSKSDDGKHNKHKGDSALTDPQVLDTESASNNENSVVHDDQLSAIQSKLQMLDSIHQNVVETKNEVSTIKSEISEIKTSLSSVSDIAENAMKKATDVSHQLHSFGSELEQVKNDMSKLKIENKQLREQITRSEAQSRRDNLILGGVEEKEKEDCLDIVYNILTNMRVGMPESDDEQEPPQPDDEPIDIRDKIKITRCHRLGPKKPNKTRTIIFKCHFFPDRQMIWDKKSNLKNTGMWLSEDYPLEIIKRRRFLDPIRKKAIEQGSYAVLSVDRLVINNNTFTVDTVNKLPPSLRPENVYTRRTDTHTGFFSQHSPLSNFHYSFFKADGVRFASAEQYFQYYKALHCDDIDISRDILRADEPAECKRLGNTLTIPDQKIWEEESLEIMYKACYTKFQQNIGLRDFLLSTKDTVLVEANPHDKFWGVGLKISHNDLFKPEHWKGGKNHLGKILRRIRDHFSGVSPT